MLICNLTQPVKTGRPQLQNAHPRSKRLNGKKVPNVAIPVKTE